MVSVKQNSASQVAKCKKLLSSEGREKPTISHYRDMENPNRYIVEYSINGGTRPGSVQVYAADKATAKREAIKEINQKRGVESVDISKIREIKIPNPVKVNERTRQTAYNKAKKMLAGGDSKSAIVAVLSPYFGTEEIKRIFEHLGTAAKANPARKYKLVRRTFEAKKYPKGSAERARLNESVVTSEYAPSDKFIVLETKAATDTHHAITTSHKFKTRQSAESAIEYWDSIYNTRNKRNATHSDFKKFTQERLKELASMFQGEWQGVNKRIAIPDAAPKDLFGLGHLKLLKIKANGRTYAVNVTSDDAYVAGDIRCNLWFVGRGARITDIELPAKGELKRLGHLIQVDYVTSKAHIEGGKLIRFWHKLGEVSSRYPTLYVDHDGFPVIVGGEYDIWDVGIVN